MDGQKQIYILGFRWIADNGGGGEGVLAGGDGDINKWWAPCNQVATEQELKGTAWQRTL
ncbi:hypothetical protein [Pygmaiobacter massiliensis]|uniref:hypothetical protein n=1 Tax=Pygmaiobacter massiliensis TaxID=1917873 RepID=UPI002A815626|nr:hypothetical protein [Pygmaiobacter massiliensis]MDY4784393.1 hypothetical protein [Pygmaiobacter massiliensis]